MGAVETGRRIDPESVTPEVDWLAWLARLDPEALELDAFIQPDQRLVVVSPHPDDEVLGCGGLMAMHAARGGDAQVIAVTDGEASHRSDRRWSPQRLAAARRAERLLGLARLGIESDVVTRLSLPDSEVNAQSLALEQALRVTLRPSDSVISTWRLDGHPDHDTTGAVAARVCASIGCRLVEAPVWMWQWSVPGDARVPWDRLRKVPLAADALRRKAAALATHETQFARRATDAPVLGKAILARAARSAEYFIV